MHACIQMPPSPHMTRLSLSTCDLSLTALCLTSPLPPPLRPPPLCLPPPLSVCQAGPEGVLTPDLTCRMGIAPKVFLKGLPDMCRRYGVKVRPRRGCVCVCVGCWYRLVQKGGARGMLFAWWGGVEGKWCSRYGGKVSGSGLSVWGTGGGRRVDSYVPVAPLLASLTTLLTHRSSQHSQHPTTCRCCSSPQSPHPKQPPTPIHTLCPPLRCCLTPHMYLTCQQHPPSQRLSTT